MMKFLRHLLSHIMFLILISGIVAIYYFRNQVMPDEYVKKINFYAEKIHPAMLTFKNTEKEILVARAYDEPMPDVIAEKQTETEVEVAEQVIEEVIVKPEEANDIKTEAVATKVGAVEKKAEVKAEVIVKEEVVAPLVVVPLKQEKEQELTKMPVADVPVAEKEVKSVEKQVVDTPAPVVEEKTEIVVVAAPVKAKETVETVKEAVALSSDVAAADYKGMLQSARALFQNKKFKESVNQYKELIELENHEADFYGELGNVYYTMGSWNLAGEAYYEAAQRLIETGKLSQVYYLQRVLQGLDKNRADKLKNHLSGLAQ